jgi:azurin
MGMKIRGWLALGTLAIAITATGCSRSDPSLVARAETSTEVAGGGGGGGPTIDVAATPSTAYQQTELQAPANQAFTVSFTNPAALPHNWVLAQPGKEQAVAQAADPQGNVPAGTEGVIAAGAIITNKTEPIPVEALAAGTYTYLCTFPGHYLAGMKGTLTVGP